MKSILVIGMGRFGRHLAKKMLELGNDVAVIDSSSDTINRFSAVFTDCQIGDCTNEEVIKSLGVDSFDICFVAIGEDFQSSLVATSLLKKYGAKMIIAKANQDIQADLLRQIGADEIAYPERESAEKLAVRYNAKNIFDFIQLTSEYSIYEIAIPADWSGKAISDIRVRQKYGINIIAIKTKSTVNAMPGADYIFSDSDHIIIIGKSGDVFRLASKT